MDNNKVRELINKQASKSGLRGKVNAKCIECIYDADSGNGSWKQQIEACTSPLCPLYSVRVKSDSLKGADNAKNNS